MAAPAKIAHIVFRTRKYDEMIAWYQRVFEARVQHQNPVIAFLTYDDEHHRLAFINLAVAEPGKNDRDTAGTSGIDHVAFTFDTLDDLIDTYTRLKAEGIKPYWPIHHGITISFYYKDPDNNRIEFQADCFATAEEGTAFMRSEAFAENSIGVNIDADELVTKYRQGIPAEELFARPAGPPAGIPPEHGIGG